jgi:hypothetical protein
MVMTVHEIFNTAIANAENPGTALGSFGSVEFIKDAIHSSECLHEICEEKKFADGDEVEKLNIVGRFIMTAPYGECLSRVKVDETGKYVSC